MGSALFLILYPVIVNHHLDSFRWVSRWLDGSTLERVRDDPNWLGTPLDETFAQDLHNIPEEKNQHALLLFQCLIASIRPLCVKELGRIFATELNLDPTSDGEEAVLAACSTSIVIVAEGSKIVQFSHTAAREFLISKRLPALYPNISRYGTSLEAAHIVLSRACVNVLLRLDETADEAGLENSPLASHAIQYWVDHTQYPNVASQNKDIMERLFDPSKPHQAWIWMCDIGKGQKRTMDDLSSNQPQPTPTPLYYVGLYGFSGLVRYLVNTCHELVDIKGGYHGTPLHAASYKGHLNTVQVLIEVGANVKTTNGQKTPLHAAFYGGHLDAMRDLLKGGADVDARDFSHNTLLHQASLNGQAEFVDLLLEYGADTKACNENSWTPLHRAVLCGQIDVVQRLLEKGANVKAQSRDKNTPLHIASITGKLDVVQLLLKHGADVTTQGENDLTPPQVAEKRGHDGIAKLLSRSDYVGRRFELARLRRGWSSIAIPTMMP